MELGLLGMRHILHAAIAVVMAEPVLASRNPGLKALSIFVVYLPLPLFKDNFSGLLTTLHVVITILYTPVIDSLDKSPILRSHASPKCSAEELCTPSGNG